VTGQPRPPRPPGAGHSVPAQQRLPHRGSQMEVRGALGHARGAGQPVRTEPMQPGRDPESVAQNAFPQIPYHYAGDPPGGVTVRGGGRVVGCTADRRPELDTQTRAAWLVTPAGPVPAGGELRAAYLPAGAVLILPGSPPLASPDPPGPSWQPPPVLAARPARPPWEDSGWDPLGRRELAGDDAAVAAAAPAGLPLVPPAPPGRHEPCTAPGCLICRAAERTGGPPPVVFSGAAPPAPPSEEAASAAPPDPLLAGGSDPAERREGDVRRQRRAPAGRAAEGLPAAGRVPADRRPPDGDPPVLAPDAAPPAAQKPAVSPAPAQATATAPAPAPARKSPESPAPAAPAAPAKVHRKCGYRYGTIGHLTACGPDDPEPAPEPAPPAAPDPDTGPWAEPGRQHGVCGYRLGTVGHHTMCGRWN
jgi:hypothetical protein